MPHADAPRPGRVVLVAGTATDVGKTWVSARILTEARDAGLTVSARKPLQSFDPSDGSPTDADVLARASGESPDDVCPPANHFPLAMAPPMAASHLGREIPTTDRLVAALAWPGSVDLGLVEAVGGVRSPLAANGDTLDLADDLRPDVVVLVADAGLGTINAVRLCTEALEPHAVVVLLNRFDPADAVAAGNLTWLTEWDGYDVETEIPSLVRRITSAT